MTPTTAEIAARARLSPTTVRDLLDGRIGHPGTIRLVCAAITATLTPAPPTAPVETRPGDTWRADAACLGMGPAVFYPSGRGLDAQVAAAQRVCRSCPVLRECGDHATATGEIYGVWAGVELGGEERDRGRLRRSRRHLAVAS
jgi:WhiB family redox-sensing transcriptional regulator